VQVAAIADGLSHNCLLRKLDFADNSLGDAGTAAIVRSLRRLDVGWLSLARCDWGVGGGAAIAEVLRSGAPQVQRLDPPPPLVLIGHAASLTPY